VVTGENAVALPIMVAAAMLMMLRVRTMFFVGGMSKREGGGFAEAIDFLTINNTVDEKNGLLRFAQGAMLFLVRLSSQQTTTHR
jgi:hypothetical protein